MDKHDLLLWYEQPASDWLEALPVGNGRLGAMIFGGSAHERIQFNEETLWSGGPYDSNDPEAAGKLDELRSLLDQGKNYEAEQLAHESFMAKPRTLQAYQPFGNLFLEFAHAGEPERYERSLDLAAGIAGVRYAADGAEYVREIFCSVPEQALVISVTCSRPGGLSLEARLQSMHSSLCRAQDGFLLLEGQWQGEQPEGEGHPLPDEPPFRPRARWSGRGLRFAAVLSCAYEGGAITVDSDGIHVSGTDRVVLRLAARTSYNREQPGEAALSEAAPRPYEASRDGHLRDYMPLFSHVSLRLGTPDSRLPILPTDKRLGKVRRGEEDPGLAALLFQYGRYLLLASSREGCLPANLQGIWNEDPEPAWGGKWTLNINLQMNYWPAEVCNLSGCHRPLFELLDSLRPSGRETARLYYGCGGFTAHHNTDLWRTTAPSDFARTGLWAGSAAWLCLHLWRHYAFHNDVDFLREKAFPIMREAAEFWLDFLIGDAQGHLVSSPSISPENRFLDGQGRSVAVCAGPSMDTQIVGEFFEACEQAAGILGTEEAFRRRISQARARLAPLRVCHGRLMEWAKDYTEAEPGHRHMGHLYTVYPGNAINRQKAPELARAAHASLLRRLEYGGGSTGWSAAWVTALAARLEEPALAHCALNKQLREYTADNLLNLHPPAIFQIDGNFGAAAAIAELLLQSREETLYLLPSLPGEWDSGEVRGLRAAGGYTVDIQWERGEIQRAVLRADCDREQCAVYTRRPVSVSAHEQPVPCVYSQEYGLNRMQFQAQAGVAYTLF